MHISKREGVNLPFAEIVPPIEGFAKALLTPSPEAPFHLRSVAARIGGQHQKQKGGG